MDRYHEVWIRGGGGDWQEERFQIESSMVCFSFGNVSSLFLFSSHSSSLSYIFRSLRFAHSLLLPFSFLSMYILSPATYTQTPLMLPICGYLSRSAILFLDGIPSISFHFLSQNCEYFLLGVGAFKRFFFAFSSLCPFLCFFFLAFLFGVLFLWVYGNALMGSGFGYCLMVALQFVLKWKRRIFDCTCLFWSFGSFGMGGYNWRK